MGAALSERATSYTDTGRYANLQLKQMRLPGHFGPSRVHKWAAREESVNDHLSVIICDFFGPG